LTRRLSSCNSALLEALHMILIVFFIFCAVIMGAGAMLSPAYPTVQPRIGFSAALALALIAGGAVFYGTAAGWNTLVVDYMLFLLVISIFLGGTLNYGQKRAEAQGEELSDADQGWPGPFDLLGLVAAFALYLVIAVFFAVPDPALSFDAAQINSGSLSLYTTGTPAFTTVASYLSGQLGAPVSDVQAAMSAVLAGMAVWLAYDLGAEFLAKPLGRRLAFLTTPLLVIPVAVGAGPLLMGIVFLMALTAFALRYIRHGSRVDIVTSGLMLGAVALTIPPLPVFALALVIGAGIWVAVRKSPARGMLFAGAAVIIALIATLPTLLSQGWKLLG
jgi:hypothetical protein